MHSTVCNSRASHPAQHFSPTLNPPNPPLQEFKDGIVNGAKWYVIYHSMQDWTYVAKHALALTLELSQNKTPPESTLQDLWSDNKDALIELALGMALGGIHGKCFGHSTSAGASKQEVRKLRSRKLTSGGGQRLNGRVEEEWEGKVKSTDWDTRARIDTWEGRHLPDSIVRKYDAASLRLLSKRDPDGPDSGTSLSKVSKNDAGVPLPCRVTLDEQDYSTVASERFGDFHRVVTPGKHVLKVEMEGHETMEVEVEVSEGG